MDLRRSLEALDRKQSLRTTTLSVPEKWRELIALTVGHNQTILFYPEVPGAYHKARTLCALCGFKWIGDPSRAHDVQFQFYDVTRMSPDEVADGIDLDQCINGRCLDISKHTVSQRFEEVFGYSITVDPATHTGTAVQKSDENGTHDGEVITCPLPRSSIEDEKVYQKLIDTRTEDGLFVDYRVAVCGRLIPLVLLTYRPSSDRFKETHHWETAPIEDVFTESERAQLRDFVDAMHLDYAELDVLRDREDGRIYVVDANTTPSTTAVGEEARTVEKYKDTWRRWRRALAGAFADMIAEAAARPN
jgi:hypothetical protein